MCLVTHLLTIVSVRRNSICSPLDHLIPVGLERTSSIWVVHIEEQATLNLALLTPPACNIFVQFEGFCERFIQTAEKVVLNT